MSADDIKKEAAIGFIGPRDAPPACRRARRAPGRALIKLAGAHSASRYVGCDVLAPTIARATANAEAPGVADRVRFEARDVSQGLPAQYDVITTRDVVHDAVDPRGLRRTIRQALKPGGIYVCLEINTSHNLEKNAGTLGAMFYSVSVLYCMTISLAHHGEGLGTVGMHEPRVRQFCRQAGFSEVRLLPHTAVRARVDYPGY